MQVTSYGKLLEESRKTQSGRATSPSRTNCGLDSEQGDRENPAQHFGNTGNGKKYVEEYLSPGIRG
jgi:hypothetical protein